MSSTIDQGLGWQPIATCPREEGAMYLVCWAGGGVEYLRWKTNRRIVDARKSDPATAAGLDDSYFGDPNEMDDYELAKSKNAPTHWMPLPEPPR